MISAGYAATMAAYNAEMNRRIYEASARLDDSARRQARGAFFGSIHATLNHLVWADTMWMSRFAGWPKPTVTIRDSVTLIDDFATLRATRERMDQELLDWTGTVSDSWLAEDLVWFSAAVNREMRRPRALLVMHFFNHQTHHRGQIHAMLTAAGQETGDTDLFLLVE